MRPWAKRIREHISGPRGNCLAFTVKPKETEKLNAQAVSITHRLGSEYNVATIVNVWMTWCEDRIEAHKQEVKREFFRDLLKELDGLYALMDPEYQLTPQITAALAVAKELEEQVR
jgi:hypothetical protein